MSILSSALSGLNAFQIALNMTSNNITNATTAGYTRQSIQLAPSMTQKLGDSYLGTGVQISTIMRNSDQFANYQLRNSISLKSQQDTLYQQSSQIDSLLSQSGVSLSASMQTFFTSLGQLNNNPADISSRNVVLKQAQLMAGQFNYMQGQVDQYQKNSTDQITQAVDQINGITKNIANLNKQLVANPGSPDLLDQRDQLVNQLAQFSDLTVYDQSNGSINVGFANGQMLVTGVVQSNLAVSSNHSSSFGTKILLQGNDVTSGFASGMIRGQLDFEQYVLSPVSQAIGQLAIGLAQQFNTQQSLGVDLNNGFGKPMFTDYNSAQLQASRSISASSNTGNGVLAVNISSISQTQVSDYNLSYDGANYNVQRKSDGNIQSFAALPATVDGMTISLTSGAINAGDTFTLTPTRGAAAQLQSALTDVKDLALAAAVRVSAPSTNEGQGTIALGTVSNTSAVNNSYAITIDPSDPTKYTIQPDPTIYTLTPGTNNTIYLPPGSNAGNYSYSVILGGTPSTGDVFNLSYNSGSEGDNSNGLLMANIQQNKVFNGGADSLVDGYANLVSNVGGSTNQAKQRADAADVINKQAVSFQSSKSGVNLDEEAANLLKFQQAYQATAKVMQIANQMMTTIFNIMG